MADSDLRSACRQRETPEEIARCWKALMRAGRMDRELVELALAMEAVSLNQLKAARLLGIEPAPIGDADEFPRDFFRVAIGLHGVRNTESRLRIRHMVTEGFVRQISSYTSPWLLVSHSDSEWIRVRLVAQRQPPDSLELDDAAVRWVNILEHAGYPDLQVVPDKVVQRVLAQNLPVEDWDDYEAAVTRDLIEWGYDQGSDFWNYQVQDVNAVPQSRELDAWYLIGYAFAEDAHRMAWQGVIQILSDALRAELSEVANV